MEGQKLLRKGFQKRVTQLVMSPSLQMRGKENLNCKEKKGDCGLSSGGPHIGFTVSLLIFI